MHKKAKKTWTKEPNYNKQQAGWTPRGRGKETITRQTKQKRNKVENEESMSFDIDTKKIEVSAKERNTMKIDFEEHLVSKWG